MSYNGRVALLVCSFIAVLLAAMQPFMQSGLRAMERHPVPRWTALAAAALLLLAAFSLRPEWRGQDQIMGALCATSVLVGGAFVTWLLGIFLRKPPELREADFMRGLLLAPLAVLLAGDGVFAAPVSLSLRALLRWFVCGFLAQALVSLLTRWLTPKRIIIRRREP